MKKRIIYAGTPDFAVPALQLLIDNQSDIYEVVAVYTQPDRPAGRGRKLQPSPVKACALEHGIPVYQPLNFKDQEDRAELESLHADLMVVAAYGLLLPESVLAIPSYGCVNLHASLLPRWRGAAPIQRAIEAGDEETGITLMQIDVGLDTGDMLDKVVTPISEQDTGQSMHDRLARLGGQLLMKNLNALLTGSLQGQQQEDANASYAKKLNKQEAQIDWSKSSIDIVRQIKAMNPWPVMQTIHEGKVVRVWDAAVLLDCSEQPAGTVVRCSKQGLDISAGENVVRITQLQLPGKKAVDVMAFSNAHDWSGAKLGHADNG